MYKPDIERVQEILEERWVANDFTKLTEPVDGASGIYSAAQLTDEDCQNAEQFRFMFLEPSLLALERGVRDEENNEYYQILAYYQDNVLVVTSSRGLLPDPVELS